MDIDDPLYERRMTAWRKTLQRAVKASARRAVFLQRTGLPVPLAHPARSYFGGLPRLPKRLAWPRVAGRGKDAAENHRALLFIAQIDLAELPRLSRNPLPSAGTLYFFLGVPEDDHHDVRVLYYKGRADALPLRQPPAQPPEHGPYWPRWPWLTTDEPAGQMAFKYPMAFTKFDSYCDFAGIDDCPASALTLFRESGLEAAVFEIREQAARLQRTELAAKLTRTPRRSSTPRDELAFAWGVIAHCARAIRCEMEHALWVKDAPPAQQVQLAAISQRTTEWLQRAAAHPDVAACDKPTRKWFKQEWTWMRLALQELARRSLDPGLIADRATQLVCCLCASDASAAAAPISAAHRRRYEARAARHPKTDTTADPPTQLLGHGTSVQWAPIQHTKDVLLLQVSGAYGLEWCDHFGCVLQLWIKPAALARRDFSKVQVTLECD